MAAACKVSPDIRLDHLAIGADASIERRGLCPREHRANMGTRSLLLRWKTVFRQPQSLFLSQSDPVEHKHYSLNSSDKYIHPTRFDHSHRSPHPLATTTWYGTGPLMCMLSTTPPVFSACAFMRSTSSMIVASFPARDRGVNLARGPTIFQSGRDSTPSVRRIFSSTRDCR